MNFAKFSTIFMSLRLMFLEAFLQIIEFWELGVQIIVFFTHLHSFQKKHPVAIFSQLGLCILNNM